MKFDFYITDNKIEAVAFNYKGQEHCSADVRNFESEEVSVHFSRSTEDGRLKEVMEEVSKIKKISIDIEPNHIEEGFISEINFSKSTLSKELDFVFS